MPWPLPSQTRRLVGWLLLIAGVLLLLGQVLRLVVTYYEYRRLGAEAISAVQLAMQLLLLLAAMLLLRYGWHERRGGGAAK